jgi:hypothetical protein
MISEISHGSCDLMLKSNKKLREAKKLDALLSSFFPLGQGYRKGASTRIYRTEITIIDNMMDKGALLVGGD